ncbi:hypothetical protein E1293_09660 [Actinomadura darangshiensis]|uniref:Uncharacterized protein n=1 Tax=Actinomadura darangshiensis TaxID=705336 RepID=A0A4R5BKI2_9ACTN|nr:hypothetical protein [Actinomadura darangshiensis]TDD86335.1 hypothetical protein E1293_09660 [Actinomadura darangshiensis]
MRSRRPARRARSLWARIAGYTGTLLLVAAAAAVLLMPLMDDGDKTAAGAQGTVSPSAQAGGQTGAPGGSGLPATPTNPVPQQNGSGRPYPGGQNGGSGGQGGGPEFPAQNGAGEVGWCPKGTAFYKAAQKGVDVVVTVASSGAIRAEMSLRGRSPESQQTTVRSGGPHAFHFTRVQPQLVERVKVTTVSVGVSMQTCYARAGA